MGGAPGVAPPGVCSSSSAGSANRGFRYPLLPPTHLGPHQEHRRRSNPMPLRKRKPQEEPKQDQPKEVDAPRPAPRPGVMLVRPARPIAPVPPNGVVQINQGWAVGGPQGFGVPSQSDHADRWQGQACTCRSPRCDSCQGSCGLCQKTLAKTAQDEIRFGLQLTPEPKLTLQQITAVRVEKAVDDKDQKLTSWVQMNPDADAVGVGGLPGRPRRHHACARRRIRGRFLAARWAALPVSTLYLA